MHVVSPGRMNATHHAVVDALSNEEGNVVNNPLKKNPRRGRHLRAVEEAPVIITRKPVNSWKCDSCAKKGKGMQAMYAHTERTMHMSYTEQ